VRSVVPTSPALRARSERKPAIASTQRSFPNSDGWKVKKPTLIQRVEPRAALPSTKTTAISPTVPMKIARQ
jgi:hypothetical protein